MAGAPRLMRVSAEAVRRVARQCDYCGALTIKASTGRAAKLLDTEPADDGTWQITAWTPPSAVELTPAEATALRTAGGQTRRAHEDTCAHARSWSAKARRSRRR